MSPASADHSPSTAKRPRLFYGWVIVAGLSVVGAVNMSLGGVNFGSFISVMGRDLGISRFTFGLANSARSISSGLSAPFLGRIIDRFGPRIPLMIAGFLVMVALTGMAFINAGWQMVLILGFLGILGMQGGMSLYSTVPLSRWFVRLRGRALSLAFVGGPIALLVTLPLTPWFISNIGWRATWVALGVVGGGIIMLVAAFVLKKQPEDMGLLPDGDIREEAHQTTGAQQSGSTATTGPGPTPDEYPWTRSEALGTRAFWMLGLGFGLSMLGSGSFVFFRIPYYVDAGIRPELVGLAAATDALMVVLGTFVLGIWIDKLSLRHGGALGILLVTIALVIAVSAVNPFSMFLSNFVFGLGQIFNTNVRNVIWPAYFGRANIGSIRGTAFTVQMVFGAIGAPLVGLVRDLTGSYQIAWVMMLAPMMIATVMIFLAVKPQPTGVSATAPSTS